MLTRPPEKFPTPPEKISIRPLKEIPNPSRNNINPLKFLNPYPVNFSTLPPKNFSTPPENFSTPPPENLSTPPQKKFLNPPENFSTPPENFSTPPENISTPLKKNQPQKYVKRYPPPTQHPFFSFSFYLISFTFQKNLKISGGGQGRIGNEKVICHVMGLGAPYRKFQSQLQ